MNAKELLLVLKGDKSIQSARAVSKEVLALQDRKKAAKVLSMLLKESENPLVLEALLQEISNRKSQRTELLEAALPYVIEFRSLKSKFDQTYISTICEKYAYAVAAAPDISTRGKLLEWIDDWLKDNISSKATPVVIRAILQSAPSKRITTLALEWVMQNERDWYSPVLLSTLLDTSKVSAAFECAIKGFVNDWEPSPEWNLLADSVVCHSDEGALIVKNWMLRNLHQALVGEILSNVLIDHGDLFLDPAVRWIRSHGIYANSGMSAALEEFISGIGKKQTSAELTQLLESLRNR